MIEIYPKKEELTIEKIKQDQLGEWKYNLLKKKIKNRQVLNLKRKYFAIYVLYVFAYNIYIQREQIAFHSFMWHNS